MIANEDPALGSMLYFSYGSNMSSKRLISRIPDAIRIGGATLDGWVLRFHKPSVDGSGKANIIPVTGHHATVWGVLWLLTAAAHETLDAIEGDGYERTQLLVLDTQGATHRVLAYSAVACDDELMPYSWYREHAVRGAIEAGLPADYVTRLRSASSMEDPDRERASREMAIYS